MPRISQMLVAVLALSVTAAMVEAAPKKKVGSVAPSGGAGETALVGLHDLRREGNKTCMSTHSHLISGGPQTTRMAAEAAALREWATFTGWEYGSAWGNPHMGADRSMKCSGSGSSFSCDYEARPCRR